MNHDPTPSLMVFAIIFVIVFVALLLLWMLSLFIGLPAVVIITLVALVVAGAAGLIEYLTTE